jgi:hypothetical protein
MLFDLRGRRRRVVQATYLTLAVLLGGGLVLFGIGGDVSGGLFDAFSERGGGGDSGNEQLEQQIDRLETRLQRSPNDEAVLAQLVRVNYQAASAQTPSGSQTIPEEGRDELQAAGRYWDRYVESTDGEPSADLARVALIVFDRGGLNQPDKAKEAVRVIAADANDTQTYLLLVQYAAAAGDTRTADLAAQKAVDLAPQRLRKRVERQAERIKTQAAAQQGQQQAPQQ